MIEFLREYVVGFLTCGGKVKLIRKLRPAWQEGLLNGIGGRVESGEIPHEAMRREFREEAGLDLTGWIQRITLHSPMGWRCFFFTQDVSWDTFRSVKTMTDETVIEVDTENLPKDILPSLRWIISLCLDSGIAPCSLVEVIDEDISALEEDSARELAEWLDEEEVPHKV